jgi:hypothetical protein
MAKTHEPPEKLHLPKETHCPSGHQLIDPHNGQPTHNMGWDAEGKHGCVGCQDKDWAVLKAVEYDNGNKAGTCPNGHKHEPDNVQYIFKAGKRHRAIIKCKICGATDPVPGVEESVQKADKKPATPAQVFDEAHHLAYDPAVHGAYEDYSPLVYRHFLEQSGKHFRDRARDKQVDFQTTFDKNGKPNFDLHTMLERGYKGGVLKDGDTISWDHFVPIAAGGSQTFHNLMATSLKFNESRGDAVPSLYEARKFGFGDKDLNGNPNPYSHEALIKAINPRNISYLNEKDEVDKGPGHIRDAETGKIVSSIGHSNTGGARALAGKHYLSEGGQPERAYDQYGDPGSERAVNTAAGTASVISEYRPRTDVSGYQQGGPTYGSGVMQLGGVSDFKIADQAKRVARGARGQTLHPDEVAAGVKTLPGELYNKTRHTGVTAHLEALEAATGPIRAPVTPNNPQGRFDTGPQGHAYFHVTPQGTIVRNPLIKAHVQRFLDMEDARRAGLPEEHVQLLGHPADFKAPEDQAAYIKRLEDVTGPIKFGNQPHTLSVAPRTPRNDAGEPLVSHLQDPGEIINPALHQHVRQYVKDTLPMRQARHPKIMLSMRKVQRDVSEPMQPCYLSASIQRQGRRNTTIRVGCQSYR